jgi:Kef-type K+ transport system membrane component KefB
MAWAIGTLMNARGLMGMLIAGVGLQKGVIDPALYSLLVLMAVITTLMMSPLFDRIYGRADRQPS